MKKMFAFVIVIAALVLSACGGATTPTQAPPAAQPTAAPAQPTAAPAQPTEAPAQPTSAPAQPTAASAQPTAAPTATPLPTPIPLAAGQVGINFWSWVPHIEDQVNEWNATHDDIKVNYINKGGGAAEYTALNTALQAGTDVPDAVQIEYQYLPGYIARGQLTNLADYGANDDKGKFVPWTWAQVSQGDAVYAYPQDAGPMVMFCNKALLDKNNIKVPTTWDEFAKAAADLHKADPNVYLTNFTTDRGWMMGMLWQSGAQPFKIDGQNIKIDLTSPEVMRVAKLWDDLIKSGNLSPVDTYTNDWNTALGKGTIACWQSGAWGTFISSSMPDFKGQWQVFPMPQWTAGGKVNGNYGGSTTAVPKGSAHPKEAAEFAKWLNTDPKPVLELTNPDKAGLFPVLQTMLSNKDWSDVPFDFWGGQKIHQVMAQASQQVDPSFQWSPFTDFVYTTYQDLVTQVMAGTLTLQDAMKQLQDKSVTYAKDQGFTVQ